MKFIIAQKFVEILRRQLTKEQYEEAVKLNAMEDNSDICHSHDHCDANMVMLEAFESLNLIVGDYDEELAMLWDEAWTEAKEIMA